MLSSIKQLEFDKQLDLLKIREFRKYGDLAVLSEVFDKYIFLIYGVALKYLADREKAKTMVTVIFEKLTIASVKDEIKDLRGWVYAKTIYELKKQINEVVPDKVYELENHSLLYGSNEIHPLDDSKRIPDNVKDCITKLNDVQRKCIDMFYFKKKCYSDIAYVLETDIHTVEKAIIAGKKVITNCLLNKNAR
jgi:RNA polymerase sigma-70 factor, ECF subfamily